MSEELKPCQFCGRKPIIEHWSSGVVMYMVKCNNPDCPVPEESYNIALRYGMVNENREPIKFYFERVGGVDGD